MRKAYAVITVDIDSPSLNVLRRCRRRAWALRLRAVEVRPSPSGKGWHLVYWVPLHTVDDLWRYTPKRYKRALWRCFIKFEKAQIEYGVPMHEMKYFILRCFLCDDEARILYDMRKRGRFPIQLLFRSYEWVRPCGG